MAVAVLVLVAVLYVRREGALDAATMRAWEASLAGQAQAVERVREESKEALDELARRFAGLRARLVRMEAVGSRVLETADLEASEFDFSRTPPLGGAGTTLTRRSQASGAEPAGGERGAMAVEPPAFMDRVDALSQSIVARQQQLQVLQSVLDEQAFQADTEVSGRPIAKGWLSSSFGRRPDPFTGELDWHNGVDFAGEAGSAVTAVAAGVVVAAEVRPGYGLLVEIKHESGYVTRYGHNHALHVEAGDVVRKGEVIADMGSSGRSTGPHVHLEILKQGRAVDPSQYVTR